MLISTGYVANAYSEARNDESWSVRHNIRSIEHHIDRDMSEHQLSHFIHRTESYIRALQDNDMQPTNQELDILSDASARIAQELKKYPKNKDLKKEVKEFRKQADAFLNSTSMDVTAEMDVMDVVEIQSHRGGSSNKAEHHKKSGGHGKNNGRGGSNNKAKHHKNSGGGR